MKAVTITGRYELEPFQGSDIMPPKKKKPGRKPADEPTSGVYVRLPLSLFRAFEDYVNGVRPGTTKQAVALQAIEQHLRSLGLWPRSTLTEEDDS